MGTRHDAIARDRNVDALLHDAIRAWDGAVLARSVGDDQAAERLTEKARSLVNEAVAEDSGRVSPAWNEARRTSDMLAGLSL